MVKAHEPDSEKRLLDLLLELGLVGRGGRPVGAPGAAWSVVTQAPEPGQPWALHEAVSERGVAEDAIADLRAREGTLALLLEGSRPVWLGVGDDFGVVRPAPADPTIGGVTMAVGSPAWVDVWEGRAARAAQMVWLCRMMEPRAPILAACACVDLAVRATKPGPMARLALDLARRWASGEEVPAEDLLKAARGAFNERRPGPRWARRRAGSYAAMHVGDAAEYASGGNAWGESCRNAVSEAAKAIGSERGLAAVVREYVGLGAALAGILYAAEE